MKKYIALASLVGLAAFLLMIGAETLLTKHTTPPPKPQPTAHQASSILISYMDNRWQASGITAQVAATRCAEVANVGGTYTISRTSPHYVCILDVTQTGKASICAGVNFDLQPSSTTPKITRSSILSHAKYCAGTP